MFHQLAFLSPTPAMSDTHGEAQSIEADVEEAKRCFALKEWSQAADAYGQVLELL